MRLPLKDFYWFVSTDEVHHFIDVYGLSDTSKATFSKKCTFHGPYEPDVELRNIMWNHSTITDPSKWI